MYFIWFIIDLSFETQNLKFKVFYLNIVANSDFKKNEIAEKLKKKNIFRSDVFCNATDLKITLAALIL